ncbi:MAG: NAD(P)/FAD-dependent oxidoreductase [Pseudomonadota bacterium]
MTETHLDVLIVGAGLSGIGAAYHLQTRCPGKSFAILEARDAIGGTWDLFRYPGIRSDSDMHTLGYRFKPWTAAKAIADGPAIRDYVVETAKENGIDAHIRFGHRVKRAAWSSDDAQWTVEAETTGTGEPVRFTCSFLLMCSGYYRYDAGYTPDFEDQDAFTGQIVHPQLWPEDLDYSGKKVVVIGSGATAVTLVPEMATDAGHVTMLQRSPTYMVSRPSTDGIANSLRRMFPDKFAYGLTRWKNILLGWFFYNRAQTHPARIKDRLLSMVQEELGPDYDIETHFTPRYNPWDQRLCLVPDSDMFAAIRDKKASITTGTIDKFVETGIQLESGEVVPADIIVTATGLELQIFGGMDVLVDGRAVDPGDLVYYKGMMFDGVPNFANVFGYTNASWTLKADLTSEFVCRLINHLEESGASYAVPRLDPSEVDVEREPPLDSGYFARAIDRLPKQGSKMPWRQNHNYMKDLFAIRYGRLDDGAMQFVHKEAPATAPKPVQVAEPT